MKFASYELIAKNNLNALVNQPRHGFFVHNLNSSSNLIVDPFSVPKKLEIVGWKSLFSFSEFTYWPELGDKKWSIIKPSLLSNLNLELNFPWDLEESEIHAEKSNGLISDLKTLNGDLWDQFQQNKFETIKIKLSANTLKKDSELLKKYDTGEFLLRFDFNSTLNKTQTEEALNILKKFKEVEYVEDPSVYDPSLWTAWNKIIPLALDHYDKEKYLLPFDGFEFLILKPITGLKKTWLESYFLRQKRIVVTNRMDNIIGNWKAFLYHLQIKKWYSKVSTPGLITRQLYDENKWLSELPIENSQFIPDLKKLELSLKNFVTHCEWTNSLDDLDPIFQEPLDG